MTVTATKEKDKESTVAPALRRSPRSGNRAFRAPAEGRNHQSNRNNRSSSPRRARSPLLAQKASVSINDARKKNSIVQAALRKKKLPPPISRSSSKTTISSKEQTKTQVPSKENKNPTPASSSFSSSSSTAKLQEGAHFMPQLDDDENEEEHDSIEESGAKKTILTAGKSSSSSSSSSSSDEKNDADSLPFGYLFWFHTRVHRRIKSILEDSKGKLLLQPHPSAPIAVPTSLSGRSQKDGHFKATNEVIYPVIDDAAANRCLSQSAELRQCYDSLVQQDKEAAGAGAEDDRPSLPKGAFWAHYFSHVKAVRSQLSAEAWAKHEEWLKLQSDPECGDPSSNSSSVNSSWHGLDPEEQKEMSGAVEGVLRRSVYLVAHSNDQPGELEHGREDYELESLLPTPSIVKSGAEKVQLRLEGTGKEKRSLSLCWSSQESASVRTSGESEAVPSSMKTAHTGSKRIALTDVMSLVDGDGEALELQPNTKPSTAIVNAETSTAMLVAQMRSKSAKNPEKSAVLLGVSFVVDEAKSLGDDNEQAFGGGATEKKELRWLVLESPRREEKQALHEGIALLVHLARNEH